MLYLIAIGGHNHCLLVKLQVPKSGKRQRRQVLANNANSLERGRTAEATVRRYVTLLLTDYQVICFGQWNRPRIDCILQYDG